MTETLLYLLSALLVLIGLAGAVLPALPGLPVMYAGLFLAAWTGGFEQVGWITLLVVGLLMVVATLVDLVASLLGTKRVGASGQAVAGAALGTVVGIFFGLPGLLLGPFAGAIVGELIAGRDFNQATRAGLGAWLGFLLGSIAKLALGFTMLGVYALGWLLG